MPGRGERGFRGGKRPIPSGKGNVRGPGKGKAKGRGKSPSSGPIRIRPVGVGDFEIVQPRQVEELELDYLEGIELWEAGEPEDARLALRFVLGACGEYLQVHVALGKIALQEKNDAKLVRGHFGYAFELVERALPHGFNGRLPKDRPANVPYYEAAEGLAACYDKMERPQDAAWVRGRIAALARRNAIAPTKDRLAENDEKPGLSEPI